MTRRTAAPPEPRPHHVHGQRFDERKPVAAPGIERVPRVIGEPERAWRQARSGDSEATARRRRELAARLLAVPSPAIDDSDPGSGECVYTWVVEDPDASAVLLSANGVLDVRDLGASELTRLEGSSLWTLSYRMPRDWRASYVVTAHRGDGLPPWRVATDRRGIRLAAMAGAPDPRNPLRSATMHDTAVSVVEGPAAPAHPWRAAPGSRALSVIDLPATPQRRAWRAWLYEPPASSPHDVLPLAIVFDGQVWAQALPLAGSLDAAIGAGALPPMRAVLVDSGDVPTRWEELGVPGGATAFVLDDLMPALRLRVGISDDPAQVVAAGASFGGLAALWLVALGGGQVGAVVAQSPSLWRFDLTAPLLAAPPAQVELQVGTLEPEMLGACRELRSELARHGRDTRLTVVTGGHDWAWWHPAMIDGLARALRPAGGGGPLR